jgi:DNA polymerase
MNRIHDERSPLEKIAAELAEQLRFYRDIGVEDIGGSLPRESRAAAAPRPARQTAETTGSPAVADKGAPQRGIPPPGIEVPEPAEGARLEQPTLFGTDDSPRSANEQRRPFSTVSLLPERPDSSLERIREDIGDCRRCKLCDERTNIVFGEGNPNATLMFIGEGPGADEDATGRPFVGRAGQLLNKIIEAIRMKREEVYIANVVKCRPPGNRTPERDETSTCEPFLFRQIAVIRPRVIVTLGLPAFQTVLRSRLSMGRVRGEWQELEGIRVMPTFHPAYLLRSPDKKREVWEDMKKVRSYLDELGA